MKEEKLKITITPAGQVKREIILEDLAAPLKKPSLLQRVIAGLSLRKPTGD